MLDVTFIEFFIDKLPLQGLLLLWMFNPYDVKWLVVISLVLLSLGTSGATILQDVLKDLVNDIDKSQDHTKTRSLARSTIWSRTAYVFGVFSAILWVPTGDLQWVPPIDWESSFLTCIITMAAALITFCTGHNIYHQGELTERPAEVFLRVFCAGIKKLLMCISRQDISRKNLETDKIGNKGITHQRSQLRLASEVKEVSGISSYKQEDTVVVKRLLRMFPMWGMFIAVSLISATGFTFFLQQYSKLYNHINHIHVPLQIYNMTQDSSRFAIPFLYGWICGSRKNEKVKIGVGMLCGVISCIFAWQLEINRLKEVKLLKSENTHTLINFLWLMPQFCVLGCMEGLTGEGLLNFYRSQMKDEPLLISYGEEYIEIVMGLGKLINIFLILVFDSQPGWFGDTINDSRLDKYYLVLVYVCSANFILYCFIARYFYKDQDLTNDDEEKDNQVLDSDDQKQGNLVLANEDQKQDNQVLASDDHQKQGNQVLSDDDQKQDNQVLSDDDQKEDHKVRSDDDQEQDHQALTDAHPKQDNQVLVNDDKKQDNQSSIG